MSQSITATPAAPKKPITTKKIDTVSFFTLFDNTVKRVTQDHLLLEFASMFSRDIPSNLVKRQVITKYLVNESEKVIDALSLFIDSCSDFAILERVFAIIPQFLSGRFWIRSSVDSFPLFLTHLVESKNFDLFEQMVYELCSSCYNDLLNYKTAFTTFLTNVPSCSIQFVSDRLECAKEEMFGDFDKYDFEFAFSSFLSIVPPSFNSIHWHRLPAVDNLPCGVDRVTQEEYSFYPHLGAPFPSSHEHVPFSF